LVDGQPAATEPGANAKKERPFHETATPEEWVKAFKDWINHFPPHPVLSMKQSAAKAFTAREKMLNCELGGRHERAAADNRPRQSCSNLLLKARSKV